LVVLFEAADNIALDVAYFDGRLLQPFRGLSTSESKG